MCELSWFGKEEEGGEEEEGGFLKFFFFFSHRLKMLWVDGEWGVPNSWLPLCVFTELPFCAQSSLLFSSSSILLFLPLIFSLAPLSLSLSVLPVLRGKGGCICHLGRSGHHLPLLTWLCLFVCVCVCVCKGTSALVFKNPRIRLWRFYATTSGSPQL